MSLTKVEKADKIVEQIKSTSFANRLLRELNFYGELEHTNVIIEESEANCGEMIIPLDEMNVLEADRAESYNIYLDNNFERIWENILADEVLEKLHDILEKMPESRRSMQLYLTNYCPQYFKGESLGLLVRY